MPPAPFSRPLPTPVDGWRGGLRGRVTWRRWPGAVDTSGLHALLRASGLPREELLHMGCPPHLLRSGAPSITPIDEAAAILGRIAWDALYGTHGDVWCRADEHAGQRLGVLVIREWFA